MKKRVSLLLAAAMTLTALTGCSSGNDTTQIGRASCRDRVSVRV